MAEMSTDSVVKYTCLACRVGWATLELQRAHYRTDWHRYNLKRKVAAMAPVTADEFRTRVLTQKSLAERKVSAEAFTAVCEPCGNKRFASQASFDNHVNSKRHKELAAAGKPTASNGSQTLGTAKKKAAVPAVSTMIPLQQVQLLEKAVADAAKASAKGKLAAADTLTDLDPRAAATAGAVALPAKGSKGSLRWQVGDHDDVGGADMDTRPDGLGALTDNDNIDDDDDDDDDDDEEFELLEDTCLFCNATSADFAGTLKHMTTAHSFIIPDLEYLVDLRTLICYLQEKVFKYFVCLKCNGVGRAFHSAEGVQQHMADKGHCIVDYSEERGQDELAPFYDFRPSYPDYVPGEENGDDDWVDDDDDDASGDAVAAGEELVAGAVLHQTLAVPGRVIPLPDTQFDPDTLEIKLPDGRKLCHRALKMYYAKYSKPADPRASVQIATLMHQYKSLGVIGASAKQVVGDARRERIKYHRIQQKAQMKMGVQHNAFQFHYREQILQ